MLNDILKTFLIQEGFFMLKNHLLCKYELEQIHKRLSIVFTN